MNEKILIIDGDNYAGKIFFVNKVEDENGINLIKTINKTIGTLSFINNLVNFNTYNKIIFTFDTPNGKNTNKELLEIINKKYGIESKGYKGKRTSVPEYKEFKKIFQNLIYFQGFEIFMSDHYEADDVIGTLAKQYYNNNSTKIIDLLSSDKDLYQLLNDKISMISGIGTKHIQNKIKYDDIIAEYIGKGLKIQNCKDINIIKCIIGDPSDNIIGIKGIANNKLKKLLADYNTIEESLIYKDNKEYINELLEIIK